MLKKEELQEAANLLNCDVSAILAVMDVESTGSGFLKDGRPVILFEAHIFSKLTQGVYDSTYPTISSRTWNRSLYVGGAKEHDRLQIASSLNRNAALQSASWGLFQIMGFNYNKCGFTLLQDFINAMYKSEFQQLKAFCNFLKHKGLDKYLSTYDWKMFAYGYNGAGYFENRYDDKLKAAYIKYKAQGGFV